MDKACFYSTSTEVSVGSTEADKRLLSVMKKKIRETVRGHACCGEAVVAEAWGKFPETVVLWGWDLVT